MIISSSINYISGQDVVIVKSGRRICGTGAALGNAPIVQNKAYFEVKIQSTGNCLLPTARGMMSLNVWSHVPSGGVFVQRGDPPRYGPLVMAAAAVGTHPTGMHYYYYYCESNRSSLQVNCN